MGKIYTNLLKLNFCWGSFLVPCLSYILRLLQSAFRHIINHSRYRPLVLRNIAFLIQFFGNLGLDKILVVLFNHIPYVVDLFYLLGFGIPNILGPFLLIHFALYIPIDGLTTSINVKKKILK